jgi:phosphatidate cytidylyltransferase
LSDPNQAASAREPVRPLPPSPVEPKSRKPRSDLPGRLVTAGILVPLVISVVVAGGLWFLGVVLALVLLGQREFYRLIEDKGAHPLVGFGLTAGAALCVVAYVGTDYQANLLMTATLLAVLVAQLGKAEIEEALASVSGTFFGVFYVGWLLSHIIPLRAFHAMAAARYGEERVAAVGIDPDCGLFFIFFTLFCVIWCDTGAYFGGRAYGKRKLAPAISPGKTVEGAVAGVLVGTVGGFVCKLIFDFFWPELSAGVGWVAVAVFGVLLSVAGAIGDLIESLLKRDADVKDTGHLLPGTGGVLDRIDSSLLAMPVMYYSMLLYVFFRVT